MSEHYYTASPGAQSDARLHAFEALGYAIKAYTDAGVFSKGGLDEGSALLLRSLPRLSGRVLDLGCGWGALTLALAKANPEAHFVMADVNERAVGLSKKNLALNGIGNASVTQGDGFENIEGAFDAIVTNPPIRAGKQVIYGFFEESARRLKDGGTLYVVIRKQQGAPSAENFLKEHFDAVERMARDKGYWILKCVKGDHHEDQ